MNRCSWHSEQGRFCVHTEHYMIDARFAFLSCTPWHIRYVFVPACKCTTYFYNLQIFKLKNERRTVPRSLSLFPTFIDSMSVINANPFMSVFFYESGICPIVSHS